MAQARGRDSHVGGEMLNYSIRDPLAHSISPRFYGWTGRGGCSSTHSQNLISFFVYLDFQFFSSLLHINLFK
jgi:hypothetical protein